MLEKFEINLLMSNYLFYLYKMFLVDAYFIKDTVKIVELQFAWYTKKISSTFQSCILIRKVFLINKDVDNKVHPNS